MPGIAYIASSAVTGGNGGGTTTTPVTMATTIPIGSDIVVFASNDTGSLNVTSVTDSQGNSYSVVVQFVGGTQRIECWEAHSTTHALTTSDTVTINHANNAGVDWRIAVAAYSNVNAVGTTNTKTQTSTAPSISLTTQDANNFVVGLFTVFAGSTGTITANTGNLRVSGGSNPAFIIVADNTAASATSVTVSINDTSSQGFDMIAVELRSQPTGGLARGMPVFFMG